VIGGFIRKASPNRDAGGGNSGGAVGDQLRITRCREGGRKRRQAVLKRGARIATSVRYLRRKDGGNSHFVQKRFRQVEKTHP